MLRTVLLYIPPKNNPRMTCPWELESEELLAREEECMPLCHCTVVCDVVMRSAMTKRCLSGPCIEHIGRLCVAGHYGPS